MDLKTICSKGTKLRQRRRIGRGIGSGSGKTSGRGHKGWGARSGTSRRPGYEGGQMPIYRRVPKRGFTNARFGVDYTVINVDTLGAFADGETVDFATILARGLASKTAPLLKVLGNGALDKRLIVRAQKFSASARSKIEAAGGSVVDLDARGREMPAPQVAAPVVAEPKPASAGEAKSKKASSGEAKSKKPRGSGEQK